MTQPEARLQRRIVKALRARGFAAWRIRPMGIAGWPDILVILPGGRAGFLEVKMPGGGEPTRLQRVRLAELETAGATVAVVRSVEEAVAACL